MELLISVDGSRGRRAEKLRAQNFSGRKTSTSATQITIE